jgi:hypothetical protein
VRVKGGVLRARSGAYSGLFMVTLATLMYEIALTRIFSVTMWYHFAFGVISLALFGMTLGALIVHRNGDRFSDDKTMVHLWLFAVLFGVSVVVCFFAQLLIPVDPTVTWSGIASVVGTCLLVSIPFIFSGVVVCLALTRFPLKVNRLYAADLVGAALGCLVFVVLISRIDGPSVVIASAALAEVGALCFAFDARVTRAKVTAVACIAIIGGLTFWSATAAGSASAPFAIQYVKGAKDPPHAFEKWNAFSRVTVDAKPTNRRRPALGMVIDSTAGTGLYRYDGDTTKVAFLRNDVTNLAHWIRRPGDVLVIGVGGGKDVLSALVFGQHSVKGVEINKNILHITNGVYGDFTGHLDRDPRVSFVNDEARAYLARTRGRYDIIQISMIDTWAATSSGAFALSENSLYTTHAWKIFMDHLKPGGILSVTRWYTKPGFSHPIEMYRTVSLGAQALKDKGVTNRRDHLAIFEGPPMFTSLSQATLLVSPQPFRPTDLTTLESTAGRLGLRPVLTPQYARDDVFADLAGPQGPGKGEREVDADISPPTDNRPFFFQMANVDSLGSLFSGSRENDLLFQPVLVLTVLALTVLILTLGFIVLPLLRTTDRVVHRGMGGFYVYFAAIGLAFLLVEVALLQRLSVYLGQPTYGLTVVLFSLLFFSGIGSMLTERVTRDGNRRSILVALGTLLGVVFAFGLVHTHLLRATESSTTPVRVLIAATILVPLSLVMGMPFAIGMRTAAQRADAPTSFMWGINGATSVCGSVFGLVLALFFGISTAFWAGAVAYAVAFGAMIAITRRIDIAPVAETEADDLTVAVGVP